MEAKNFIHKELNAFIERFKKTRIRYEYDKNALVPVVEVLPNEVYHLDNDYIQWENDFYDQFVAKFPNEDICFISDDALVGIEKPELVIEGLEYAPITCSQSTENVLFTNPIKTMSFVENVPFQESQIAFKFQEFENIGYHFSGDILKAA